MNILLTCAGRRNYMVEYFRAALAPGGGKVYAANSHPNAAAFIPADSGFVVPGLYDPDYVHVLIQICRQHEIEAIIPLFDLELPVLAEARERLAVEGIRAVVPSPAVVNICNDKWQTRAFLERHGIPAPQTFLTMDAALQALAAKRIQFPVVLKPRWGMGSIAVMEADDEKELLLLFAKARRVIEKTYLMIESNKDPEHCVLIQEKIPGQEYGLDVVNDLNGNYVTTFVKKKLAMRAGETDVAITVEDPALENLGRKISKDLGHVANLDVDVVVGPAGAVVLEQNPRFGGGYPFSHLAGANLPAAIAAWLQGEEPDPSWFRVAPGITGVKGIVPLRVEKQPIETRSERHP